MTYCLHVAYIYTYVYVYVCAHTHWFIVSRVCENAKSVAVYSGGQTVARLGVMGREQTVQVPNMSVSV